MERKTSPFSLFELSKLNGGRFVKVQFDVETLESEMIALQDSANQEASSADGSSSMSSDYTRVILTQLNALKMLHSKVDTLLQYVKAAENGETKDEKILLDIVSLCTQIPRESYNSDTIQSERQQLALLCDLSALTRGISQLEPMISYLSSKEREAKPHRQQQHQQPHSKRAIERAHFITQKILEKRS